MILGLVTGNVVSTQKSARYEGAKLLIVQPVDLHDKAMGEPLVAIDAVGAGVGEKVLVVQEGRASNEALGTKQGPMDSAIIGIVDTVDVF